MKQEGCVPLYVSDASGQQFYGLTIPRAAVSTLDSSWENVCGLQLLYFMVLLSATSCSTHVELIRDLDYGYYFFSTIYPWQ